MRRRALMRDHTPVVTVARSEHSPLVRRVVERLEEAIDVDPFGDLDAPTAAEIVAAALDRETREYFVALAIDRVGRLRALLAPGEIDRVDIDAVEIVQWGRSIGASEIIETHSHIRADATPSRGDHYERVALISALDAENITLVDSIVVAPDRGEFYSFDADEFYELEGAR